MVVYRYFSPFTVPYQSPDEDKDPRTGGGGEAGLATGPLHHS